MQPACSLLRDGRVAFQRDFRGGKRRGAKPSVQLLGNQGAALTTGTLLKEKGLEGVLLTEGETRGCGENFGHFTFRPGRAARPRLRPFCGISWQDAERVWGAQGDRFLLGITAIRPQASTAAATSGHVLCLPSAAADARPQPRSGQASGQGLGAAASVRLKARP